VTQFIVKANYDRHGRAQVAVASAVGR